jgi:hypothetical protein
VLLKQEEEHPTLSPSRAVLGDIALILSLACMLYRIAYTITFTQRRCPHHICKIDLIAILPRIHPFQDIQQNPCIQCTQVYSVTSALARITSAPDLVHAIAQMAWRGAIVLGEPCPLSLTLVADTALAALRMKLRYYLLALRLDLEKRSVASIPLTLKTTGRKQQGSTRHCSGVVSCQTCSDSCDLMRICNKRKTRKKMTR